MPLNVFFTVMIKITAEKRTAEVCYSVHLVLQSGTAAMSWLNGNAVNMHVVSMAQSVMCGVSLVGAWEATVPHCLFGVYAIATWHSICLLLMRQYFSNSAILCQCDAYIGQ